MNNMVRSRLMVLCMVILAISSLGMLSGCGKSGSSSSTADIKNVWKKFDTPAGADPSVADTLGGKGFEAVAEKLGFVTYQVPAEDQKYFGDSRAVKGGQITIGEATFPTTFRPEGQNSSLAVNTEIKGYVYETLLSTHPVTRDYVPSLASHWKISPDKKTFTFRIDPNARWSDGKPVVAEDVVESWALMMKDIGEPALKVVYGKYERPIALSKYIVQVTCKTLSFRNLLYFSSMFIYPAHEIAKLSGPDFLKAYTFNMPTGSGPYFLDKKDIKAGQGWKLTRRPDYWAKDYSTMKYAANFDYIKYIVVKDNMRLMYQKFKAGEIDLFRFNMQSTEWWVKDTDYDAMKNGWIKRYRFYTNGPMGTQGITFNMRKAPFNDIRVRKAFIMLYPRETVVKQLLFDEYETYDTDYPNTPFANTANPKTKFDPAAAMKLLADAGWTTRNADGILTKDGKPFVIEMSIAKESERWMTPYQQELRKAGIDLKISFLDWNTIIKNVAERDFQIFLYGYTGIIPPNPETSLLSSLANQKNNNNIQGFQNPRVDALLPVYDTTFSFAEQVKIIKEIDGITYNEYMKSYWWNPKGIRLGVWDKFGMPEYGLGRYAQLSYAYGIAGMSWWIDADKQEALDAAKSSKSDLGGDKAIKEYRYWQNFK